MAAFCLLHALGLTSRYWEIATLSLTPWLLLLAWPTALTAGLNRQWIQLGLGVAIIVCQVVWVGPQFKPWSSAPPPASDLRLRIFDANVSQANRDMSALAKEIIASRPQVVTLEELTPSSYTALMSSGLRTTFPFRFVKPEPAAGGEGIFSSFPLSATSAWDNLGGQIELDATVPFAGRDVRLAVAHVFAPIGFDQPEEWHAQLGRLATSLKTQGRPLIVAGDFNSTADLPEFRSILHERLSDAAVMAGDGWQMTWPRNQAWVLPYLRIDHVLLSPQLTVTSYRLGTGRGSDHKPIVVDIALAR